jgi:hypothetical protein
MQYFKNKKIEAIYKLDLAINFSDFRKNLQDYCMLAFILCFLNKENKFLLLVFFHLRIICHTHKYENKLGAMCYAFIKEKKSVIAWRGIS